MSRIRIKDIAERAGVSVGTVDRVIHKRGKVSSESLSKIQEAISSLGYSPNLVARSLAKKSSFRIATILPETRGDEFWKQQLQGLKRAEQQMIDYGFTIDHLSFNDQEIGSLEALSTTLIKGNYHAVVLAPTLLPDAVNVMVQLEKVSIPYIQINSYMNRNTDMYLGFVGQNSYQSGRLAGQLLDFTTDKGGNIVILHMENEVAVGEHMVSKEEGIKSYFADHQEVNKRYSVQWISPDSSAEQIKLRLQHLLTTIHNVQGIFVTTSRVHLIATALQELERTDLALVGFDLIHHNLEAIKKYKRLFLINQNPSLQGYYALRNLYQKLLLNQDIPRLKYLPLDVITIENADNYIHQQERDTIPSISVF